MGYLSKSAQQEIVKKTIGLNTAQLKELASANNIGYSTLYYWRTKYKHNEAAPHASRIGKHPSLVNRIKHIMETSALNESDLGAYCRSQGLYAVQLETWKKELMNMTDNEDKNKKNLQKEVKALKLTVEQLKIELRRKDRALAETAALLVLKKKANAIWEDQQDD
jgi:transposase